MTNMQQQIIFTLITRFLRLLKTQAAFQSSFSSYTYSHLVFSERAFKINAVLSDDHSAAVPLVIQPHPHVFLTSSAKKKQQNNNKEIWDKF